MSEAHRTKIGDAHAKRAPEAPMDPKDPWGTLGARVVEAKGARGARVGGGVSVRSLAAGKRVVLYWSKTKWTLIRPNLLSLSVHGS